MSLASSTDESRRNPIGSLVKKKRANGCPVLYRVVFFCWFIFCWPPFSFHVANNQSTNLCWVLPGSPLSDSSSTVSRRWIRTNKRSTNKTNRPTNKQKRKPSNRSDSTESIPPTWLVGGGGGGGASGEPRTDQRRGRSFTTASGRRDAWRRWFARPVRHAHRKAPTAGRMCVPAMPLHWLEGILPSFTGFFCKFSGFFVGYDGSSLFFWRLLRPSDGIVPSFTGFIRIYQVVSGLTGYCGLWWHCTEFYWVFLTFLLVTMGFHCIGGYCGLLMVLYRVLLGFLSFSRIFLGL